MTTTQRASFTAFRQDVGEKDDLVVVDGDSNRLRQPKFVSNRH